MSGYLTSFSGMTMAAYSCSCWVWSWPPLSKAGGHRGGGVTGVRRGPLRLQPWRAGGGARRRKLIARRNLTLGCATVVASIVGA